jgi:hypothetical protein
VHLIQQPCAPARLVAGCDRIAPTIVGLLLIAYAIPIGFHSTGWNCIGWIGIIPILTVLGICPAYSLFRFSTCSAKPAHHLTDVPRRCGAFA